MPHAQTHVDATSQFSASPGGGAKKCGAPAAAGTGSKAGGHAHRLGRRKRRHRGRLAHLGKGRLLRGRCVDFIDHDSILVLEHVAHSGLPYESLVRLMNYERQYDKLILYTYV